jgi:hypothetical protein
VDSGAVINVVDPVLDSVDFVVDSVFDCCFGSFGFVVNLDVVTVAGSVDSVVDPAPPVVILLDFVIDSVLVSVIEWVVNSVFD